MATKGSTGEKKDGLGEIIGMVVVLALLLAVMFWFTAGPAFVRGTTPILYKMSAVWQLIPGDVHIEVRQGLFETGSKFIALRGKVQFSDYFAYSNTAVRPYAVFFFMFWFLLICYAYFGGSVATFRKFNSDTLLAEISKTFTGTIPVHHLRSDLVADRDPLWARQTAPEFLFDGPQAYKANNRGLLKGRVLNRDVAKHYFEGLLPLPAGDSSGLMRSRMLGRQLVDMRIDPKRVDEVCFPDRMSDVGKVVYAIFCARAFGGKEGVDDARKAMDQLNRSCAGAAHGLPQIRVAEWLYAKYRSNEAAKHLFQVHHWEYTVIYAMFFLAKAPGKVTITEMIWLKPADRILFYVLDNVGRLVPCLESAAVFNHHAYERLCAKEKRLPMLRDEKGDLRHIIFTKNAVDGLSAYADHWVAGGDEPEDPWLTDKRIWETAANLQILLPPSPAVSSEESEFDRQQSQARANSEEAQNKSLQSLIIEEYSDV